MGLAKLGSGQREFRDSSLLLLLRGKQNCSRGSTPDPTSRRTMPQRVGLTKIVFWIDLLFEIPTAKRVQSSLLSLPVTFLVFLGLEGGARAADTS